MSSFSLRCHFDQKSEFFGLLYTIQISRPAITCSKLTTETLEQGVKYV